MALSGDLVAAARGEPDGQGDPMIADLSARGPQRLRGRDDPIEVWTL